MGDLKQEEFLAEETEVDEEAGEEDAEEDSEEDAEEDDEEDENDEEEEEEGEASLLQDAENDDEEESDDADEENAEDADEVKQYKWTTGGSQQAADFAAEMKAELGNTEAGQPVTAAAQQYLKSIGNWDIALSYGIVAEALDEHGEAAEEDDAEEE